MAERRPAGLAAKFPGSKRPCEGRPRCRASRVAHSLVSPRIEARVGGTDKAAFEPQLLARQRRQLDRRPTGRFANGSDRTLTLDLAIASVMKRTVKSASSDAAYIAGPSSSRNVTIGGLEYGIRPSLAQETQASGLTEKN